MLIKGNFTEAFRDALFSALETGEMSPVTHLAVGSGTGTDRLINEMARKPVETFEIDEGILTVSAEFDKDELPEAVREMAIIAGGTEDPGTGVAYGYARVNREGKEPQLVVGRWVVECGG